MSDTQPLIDHEDAIQLAHRSKESNLARCYIELHDRMEKMQQVLLGANDMCRSAYQIGLRKGDSTNWEAFLMRLGESLLVQNDLLQPAQNADRYWTEAPKMARISETDLGLLKAELERLQQEDARLRKAVMKDEDLIQQTLGKALEYPWYKDDQANFPGATTAHGVCVGEHVAVTIAQEAADYIRETRHALNNARHAAQGLHEVLEMTKAELQALKNPKPKKPIEVCSRHQTPLSPTGFCSACIAADLLD